jgi:hypothetical protein
MKMPIFHSSLAQGMTDLVTFKRAEGYDYTAQAVFLNHFDSFLDTQGYQKTILDRKIIGDYIVHIANQSDNSRYSRLSTVRVLSRYLHQFDPESYVLCELPVQRPARPRWYLLAPEEIGLFCNAPRASARLVHCARTATTCLSVSSLLRDFASVRLSL